ncbi:glycosyltransferase family 2 protein [Aliivibrio logei]|uniref:Glycosyltransferase 2-like domain-containing protein n=1 Tax=Aliivibrio logei TaxID=688 RepID=A0A1B9NVH2_ALILO|nr:glycosyltransferase family 2 protein [Aliivibrio logei]OCH18573.1 hypothetical protein A6E04_01760 [Aliivibrio logei]
MKKILTICIPTYNRCEKVKNTITSVLKIKSEAIDVIVSDNNSQDDTWQEINKFTDPRLKLYKQNKNVGFSQNLLDIVSRAKTSFIFLLSDDDLLESKFIDDLINSNSLNVDSVGLIYGSILKEYNNEYYLKYNNGIYSKGKAISEVALKHPYMSGMLLNKDYIDIDFVRNLIENEKRLLYPQEVMVLTILNNDNDIITLSDICCYQGVPGKSHIVDENAYYYFKERLFLFKQYVRIFDMIFESCEYRRILYSNLAEFASGICFSMSYLIWGNGFFTKVSNKFNYYKSMSDIKGMFLLFNLKLIRCCMIKIIELLKLKSMLKKIMRK